MQGINQTLTLRWSQGAQFRGEDLLDLGPASRVPALPVTLQLVGERLLYACGPPGRSHLLEHPRPLRDERIYPGGEGLVGIDPAHQGPLDLAVPPDRLDKEGFPVSELLPNRAQGNPGPGSDPWNCRTQVTLDVQRAHRVQDRPACPVRTGRTAVGWFHIGDLIQLRVGGVQAWFGQAAARRAFDVHQVILR